MREYIHFFEDSDLRDAYEYGSDYTEPYVSYTPVINEYAVYFDETIMPQFVVKKSKNNYIISYTDSLYQLVDASGNSISSTTTELVNSLYIMISTTERIIYIFPIDLNLTENSTELTFDDKTFYLVCNTSDSWDVYQDSEHTTQMGNIYKHTIDSQQSKTASDFVHYNKKYNVKFIDTYQRTSGYCGTTVVGKGYNIRNLTLVGEIPYSEVRDYIQDDTLVIISFYDTGSKGTRYGIYKKSIDTFTNTYPSSTDNTQSYRTVIPSNDYIEFEPNWIFRYNTIYCTFSDYLPTDNSDILPIDGPIIVEPISID